MKYINILTLLILLSNLVGCSQKQSENKTVSILDFGAKGDGTTLCTNAFQEAIASMEPTGGTVVVPPGKYNTGTVLLKDNITIHLEEGAEVLGSTHLGDYVNIDPFVDGVGSKRGNCLFGAKDVKNIAITGKGKINGRGHLMVYEKGDDRGERPFLMRFVRSQNLTLKDIEIRNSATWNIHLFQTDHVKIENVRILSQSEGNGDGIDIDSSQDVQISNCDINAHDDAICFKSTSPRTCGNIKIFNNRLSSRWGAIKFGTESMGDFENIEISNCYIYDTHGGGIKISSVDGANIRNINIHDLEMNNVEMPIFMRLGARMRTYRNEAPRGSIGSMDSISIRNISVHGKRHGDFRVNPPGTIFITGLEDAKISNVRIENFNAKMYSEGKAEHADKVVPQKRENYPEFTKFDGHLPAYGAYIRNAENILLKNIEIQTVRIEQRHLLKAENVFGLHIENIVSGFDEGAVVPFVFENSKDILLKDPKLEGKTSTLPLWKGGDPEVVLQISKN